ncbi:MAG: DUF6916 family protein [Planctomycetota bacterium]|jgi:hypothetical protein
MSNDQPAPAGPGVSAVGPEPGFPPAYQPEGAIADLLEKQLETPLVIEQFEGRENETFTLIEGEHHVALELVKVKRLDPQPGAPREDPWSLLFRVSNEWNIDQRLYRLASDGQDDIVLFLVPVVPDAGDSDHKYFEALFN